MRELLELLDSERGEAPHPESNNNCAPEIAPDLYIGGPRVSIISLPRFIPHPDRAIPDSETAGSFQIGAFAAKGCYDSFGKLGRSCAENQSQILDCRHGSVLEHINIGVFIEGISRACSMELNRHRFLAISQRSTRYVDESEARMVLTGYWKQIASADPDNPLLSEFVGGCRRGRAEYRKALYLLESKNPKRLSGTALRKWARGLARGVLPHCLETCGTYTTNVRAWRWIIECRSDPAAEEEIQELAAELLRVFRMEPEIEFYFRNMGGKI